MPFLNQIISFINDSLKTGSLNNKKLQPAKFYGLSTVVGRAKNASKKQIEFIPAIMIEENLQAITPDQKFAIQVYHKLTANGYSYEKKSYADGYDVKSISDLTMVIITNAKFTGKPKESIEPVVIFGLPQKLDTAMMADLRIANCLITPVSSNLDHAQVFRNEFPQSDYFLNESQSMFSIRYKIEMKFSQSCIDKCLCD